MWGNPAIRLYLFISLRFIKSIPLLSVALALLYSKIMGTPSPPHEQYTLVQTN
jgi:hypothetical protein